MATKPILCVCALLGALTSECSLATEPIVLARSPALSPDGKTLAFAYADDIWTVDSKGGRATRLTAHPAVEREPLFSPDGKQLAFTSDRSGSRQVYSMPVSGGVPTQLTFHTEDHSLQDWSADGTTLLTIGDRDHHWRRPSRLLTVSAAERSAERVVCDAYADYGRFSPNGEQVLLVREGMEWTRKGYHGARARQIWKYDSAEDSFHELLHEPSDSLAPLWKPDASGFYYVSGASGSWNLWSYDFASTERRQLTTFDDDSVLFPALSRDGSTLVFRHLFDLYRLDPRDPASLAKINITHDSDPTTDPTVRRILDDATAMTVSPDGLEIAFVAGGDVYVMDTELREPVAVTTTPLEEREPMFVDEGQRLIFIREEHGQTDLYSTEREDDAAYWWQNTSFTVTRLTNDAETERNIQRSPDGKHMAVVKGRGDLYVMTVDGKSVRLMTSGFDEPDYDWSPDSQWLAWSRQDDNFNDEVWIAPVDSSREPFNVSRHPDDDTGPRWSPDGRKLAFTGRRSAEEVDIYYVYLRADDNEQSSRDRKLEKALKKLKDARKNDASKNAAKASEEDEKKTDDDSESESKEPADDASHDKHQVVIDFDELPDRVRRISSENVAERGLFWFGDGETLAFESRVDGKSGTYTVEIPERLTPKLITTKTGRMIRRLDDQKKVAWLSSSKPGTLTTAGKTETYSFQARQQYDQHEKNAAAFDLAWRLMRDNWYDDRFNNRNWDAIRRKYADVSKAVPTTAALSEVINMMLGELNGSHLGFRPYSSSSDKPWQPETAHLGLRFDPTHNGPGLRVKDVIDDGPTDRAKTAIVAGETILAIDGVTVDPDLDPTTILNGPLERNIVLTVRDHSGNSRNETVRPISYAAARRLLYPQFIEQTQDHVNKRSKGKLGYLHIEKMNQASFLEFERQLYNAGYGKEGLIIDVRENGGGFTTDHLLTALTQPQHAITVPRGGGPGYPHDRKVYATWNKPIVVLCNQNSFSNAEIFSHAIKGLKRGKLIGVPTAGGVISTGSASVMDIGYIRQPFRGWYVLQTGQDMELNGAIPDHILWPEPGELPAGIDRQLDKAIQVLKREVRKWKKRPQPELIKASEREAS